VQAIAIVGTGIAGMAAGYFLRDQYDITFYEKNDYPGGHTNTLTVDEDGQPIYIDSAFMVYNEVTYPNLTHLFNELNVATKPTSMSFSVQHRPSGLEYCGTGLSGLFAQRKNLLNLYSWKMILDMRRFNHEAVDILDDEKFLSYTIADYVREKGFGEDFLYKFLIPMSSAVWSCPPDLMLKFPMVTLVRFFKNHGFLGLHTHYPWRTVVGGSRNYREKILGFLKGKVHLNNPAQKVFRQNGKAVIHDSRGQKTVYDKVILACHADEALAVLGDPTDLERRLLQGFSYYKNKTTLHTDDVVMPKTRRAWSSWNYRIETDQEGRLVPSTIYYMNSLQHVSQKKDYFVSINDPDLVNPQKILWQTEYAHPVYDVAAIRAQQELPRLNENGVRYFCGAYFKYGFHEDGLTAGIHVAESIRGGKVWS